MPATPRETVLCRYHYDPLDRLFDCVPSAEAGIQRFYCKSRLATEIQGAVQRSVFQHDDQLLAQLRREGVNANTTLLATDQQRSVLNLLDATGPHPLAYMPYGHRPAENGLLSLLGFNGERPDPVTGHYLLGNGYRAFNPVLMRFNSPDSLSPFGDGGVNAYGYCGGDPRNRVDSTGHSPIPAVVNALTRLRQARHAISSTSRAISKPTSANRTPITSDTSHMTARDLEKLRRRKSEIELTADLKKLTDIIRKNEAALPASQKARYTSSVTTIEIDDTTWGYEIARREYGFTTYPDPNILHIWEGKVDVGHLDITVKHLWNLTSLKFHRPAKNPNLARRAEIIRADYLMKHLGIDLMAIWQ